MKRPKKTHTDDAGEEDDAPPGLDDFDAGALLSDAQIETAENIDRPRVHRRRPARRSLLATKQEELEGFYTAIPAPGESLHIVSNGTFDYWCFIPVTLRILARPAAEFYGSTWTMNRDNVGELFRLFDSGRIQRAAILTGTYFKRRESAVANSLIEGLAKRRQRYVAFQNHAKVMLLAAPPDFIVFEGSANFTANPRLEQTVLSNDKDLYHFHRAWMESILPPG